MKKLVTIILALALVLTVVAGVAACGKKIKDAEEVAIPALELETPDYSNLTVPADFKIGMICLHDESSTYDLNFINAAKAAVKELGMAESQLIIKTGIDEKVVCYNTAKDLANQGCKVIFADSFGHEPFMLQAAKEFPNVQFCHATGTTAHTENQANFHNAFASIYEGRFLAGIAAGMKLNEMNKDKADADKNYKMGYVGAYPYEEVKSGYTSFYLGAKSVCPQVTMDVQFTGEWYDVVKENEAAKNLINNKHCALISQHADSMGAPSACEEAGVPNVSYNGSTIDSCPKTFIVSSRINWTPYVKYIIAQTVKGEAIVTDYVGTLKDGSVALTGVNGDVMAEGTIEAIVAARAKLVAGTLEVFDVAKDNYITVNGAKVTSYMANVDSDAAYTPDHETVENGAIKESKHRSAPYFGLDIDGITLLN